MTSNKRLLRILRSPEDFTQAVNHIHLRPYQVEAFQAIWSSIRERRGDSFVLIFSRQSGKDELIADLIVYLFALLGSQEASIVCAQPTFTPQTLNAMDRLEARLDNHWLRKAWRRTGGFKYHFNKAVCTYLSAVPASQLLHLLDLVGLSDLACAEHFFALPAWTSGAWINDPGSETNGVKLAGSHYGRFQAGNTNHDSTYYRPVTSFSAKQAYLTGMAGFHSEIGIHFDDGSLNNYLRIGFVFTSVGFMKVTRYSCIAGTLTTADVLTGLPMQPYTLRLVTGDPSYFYLAKDINMPVYASEIVSTWMTPLPASTRIGFYFKTTDDGPDRYSILTHWKDNFA